MSALHPLPTAIPTSTKAVAEIAHLAAVIATNRPTCPGAPCGQRDEGPWRGATDTHDKVAIHQ
jgi:hypothetical protein